MIGVAAVRLKPRQRYLQEDEGSEVFAICILRIAYPVYVLRSLLVTAIHKPDGCAHSTLAKIIESVFDNAASSIRR